MKIFQTPSYNRFNLFDAENKTTNFRAMKEEQQYRNERAVYAEISEEGIAALREKLEEIKPEEYKNTAVSIMGPAQKNFLMDNREAVLERINHTVMHSAALFSEMRAGILQEVREDKGQYGYAEVVNACGLSYAKLYAEIEERHQSGEHFFKPDGTPLTKEDEIAFLDEAFDNEWAWQKSCITVAAQRERFQGNLSAVPDKEMEKLEENFYQTKDAYMAWYEESKQTGKPLTLQKYIFGNTGLYELFDCLNSFN